MSTGVFRGMMHHNKAERSDTLTMNRHDFERAIEKNRHKARTAVRLEIAKAVGKLPNMVVPGTHEVYIRLDRALEIILGRGMDD